MNPCVENMDLGTVAESSADPAEETTKPVMDDQNTEDLVKVADATPEKGDGAPAAKKQRVGGRADADIISWDKPPSNPSDLPFVTYTAPVTWQLFLTGNIRAVWSRLRFPASGEWKLLHDKAS